MSIKAVPAIYKRINHLQRTDVKDLIDEFGDIFQLRKDGGDTLMDIGCGTGDVLMDLILPMLPKSHAKVIGTDISPEMIAFSAENYAGHEKVHFEVMDIETDKMPLNFYDEFDHVTSFFALNWVHNQRQALQNIYNMLKKGGDCFFVIVASTPGFESFPLFASYPKWSKYMEDAHKFVPIFQKHPNAWLLYTNLLKEAGFTDCHVEIRHKTFPYEGYENYKNHVMSLNPFACRIPPELRKEYENEMFEYWKNICVIEKMEDKNDHRYIFPYTVIVARAKK